MALDGIYLYSLINELKDFAINSKIDKVNQPEKDEIILTLRGKETKKLLISSSSNYPRLHFTTINKINPLKAPVFCMVLRKYLIGGKIIDITQYSTDRIISIDIENKDELGFDSKYSLIVEIMARHSNITLVRKRDNKIMESIKHIHSNKNSYRVLYPGATFIMPPTSNKLNPFSFTKEELKNLLKENINFNESIFSKIITGVGKNLSNDLFIEYKNKFNDLTIDNLSVFITDYFKNILKDNKNILFFKDGKVVDFYFKDLISLNNCEKKYFESHSDTLDNFYATKDKQDRLHSKGLDIQRLINTNIERCLKKIKILEKTLKECEAKEDYRIKG